VVDYIMFPFSGNPSAPHYPPFSGVLDSLESTGVHVNQDQVSVDWILQLRAVRRMHLTLTSEFSKERHDGVWAEDCGTAPLR
jgi:hypothetical protein